MKKGDNPPKWLCSESANNTPSNNIPSKDMSVNGLSSKMTRIILPALSILSENNPPKVGLDVLLENDLTHNNQRLMGLHVSIN